MLKTHFDISLISVL